MDDQIRQGGIFLLAVDKQPPKDVAPQREVILAYGEATGHAHRLSGAVLDWTEDGQRYVQALYEDGALQHEDHDPEPAKVLTQGVTYRVIQQQVWDLSGEWRNVQD